METNMKEMLAQLATTTQKAEIESVLQQTTAQLLHHYKIRAREVELYPIELAASQPFWPAICAPPRQRRQLAL